MIPIFFHLNEVHLPYLTSLNFTNLHMDVTWQPRNPKEQINNLSFLAVIYPDKLKHHSKFTMCLIVVYQYTLKVLQLIPLVY